MEAEAPMMDVGSLKAWAAANGERPIDRHALKARTLPDGDHEGTARHPFPVTDRETYLSHTRGRGIAAMSHKAPVGRVQLGVLKGIQHTVNRERLAQHLADPRLIPTGARASGNGALVDLPIVVKVNGEYHVHDGHHRLTAAHLRGEPDARVRLVDLDSKS